MLLLSRTTSRDSRQVAAMDKAEECRRRRCVPGTEERRGPRWTKAVPAPGGENVVALEAAGKVREKGACGCRPPQGGKRGRRDLGVPGFPVAVPAPSNRGLTKVSVYLLQ